MRRSVVFLALLLFAVAGRSEAAPITLIAGQSQIFNWDFVSQNVTPAPPYASMGVDLFVGDRQAGENFAVSFYGDLDAAGSAVWDFFNTGAAILADPELVDGIFSLRISVSVGSIIFDPQAFAGDAIGQRLTGFVAPLEQTAPVPEPATLSLLGIGLAGASLRRWRQRRSS